MDTDKLGRFVELTQRKRDLKNELSDINKDLDSLQVDLLKQFEESGMQSARIKGMTVYLNRQIWAGAIDGDQERTIRALKAAGLADYVAERFNTQSLSAWVREQIALADDDDLEDLYDALPPEFRDNVKITEKFELRARRG